MDGKRALELLESIENKYTAMARALTSIGSPDIAGDYLELAEAVRTAIDAIQKDGAT